MYIKVDWLCCSIGLMIAVNWVDWSTVVLAIWFHASLGGKQLGWHVGKGYLGIIVLGMWLAGLFFQAGLIGCSGLVCALWSTLVQSVPSSAYQPFAYSIKYPELHFVVKGIIIGIEDVKWWWRGSYYSQLWWMRNVDGRSQGASHHCQGGDWQWCQLRFFVWVPVGNLHITLAGVKLRYCCIIAWLW